MIQKQLELNGHAGAVYSGTFDGTFLYTASADKYVTRWNLTTGVQDKFAIKFDHTPYCIHIALNMLWVGLANGDLHVFDLIEKKEINYFKLHKEAIFSISFNAVSHHVYVGDADGNVSVWDAGKMKLLISIPLNSGKIRDIAVDEINQSFCVASQDGFLRVIDATNFNELQKFFAHKDGATSVIFNPKDQNQLISGGKDALLKYWDIESANCFVSIPAHNYAVYRILALNSGSCLITASRDKSLKIWDTIPASFIQKIERKSGGHSHSVNDIVAMNENTFASVSEDKKAIVWTVS